MAVKIIFSLEIMQKYKTNCLNHENYKIKCGNKLVNLCNPIVMGILNITPDSFFDGGKYTCEEEILKRANGIVEEGATIIDLGAYSTRPGAEHISAEEEYDRMAPAVALIRDNFPDMVISIDTFRAEVARRIINQFGACIINDISGGTMDNEMFATVADLQVPYIMMHIQGTPQTMQNNPEYNNLMEDIGSFFTQRIAQLKELGVDDIIIDPGFGFGKTIEHNYEIVSKLQEFKKFNVPLLAGLSRKSMIYKFIGGSPSTSLNGTSVLNTMCLERGANILRVHDVKQAVECVKLVNKVKINS